MTIERAKQLTALTGWETPVVANGIQHASTRSWLTSYTGPEIRRVTRDRGIRCGTAVTVQLDATSPGADRPVNRCADWIKAVQETATRTGGPVVVVVEMVGPRAHHAVCMGDIWASLLVRDGVVGCVSNGSARDLPGLEKVGLSTWCAGSVGMHGRPGRVRWLAINEPVQVGDMVVRPGDVIHGDDSGVVCIASEDVGPVVVSSDQVHRLEASLLHKLQVENLSFEEAYTAFLDEKRALGIP